MKPVHRYDQVHGRDVEDALDIAVREARENGTLRTYTMHLPSGDVEAMEFDLLPTLEHAERQALARAARPSDEDRPT